MDPYVFLNLSDAADDATVKAAYLTALRQSPPEQNPEMFEMIRTAYESIATERQRLKHQLFHPSVIDKTTIIYACLDSHSQKVYSENSARQILQEGARASIEKNLSQL